MSSCLYSRAKIFVFVVSRRRLFYFCVIYLRIISEKNIKESENQKSLPFNVCRKRHAQTLLYLLSVPKIAEITHAIYQRLSKRRLCKEYVRRKVKNPSGVNLRRNFAFVCTPSFSSRVITWLEPAIQ